MTTYQIVLGDNLDTLRRLPDNCIDSVVCDPPYELGFMGKKWDASGVAFDVERWGEVLRVLKPGGHLLAFSGTRTYHHMVCAIEDAGFEIRDQLGWFYGQGMPKSLDLARQVDMFRCTLPGRHCDKNLPAKRRPDDHLCPPHPDRAPYVGRRTALSPAQEPIVLARKPLIGTVAANVLQYNTGGINVDACRLATADKWDPVETNGTPSIALRGGADGSLNNQRSGSHELGRWPANVLLDEWLDPVLCLRSNAPVAVQEFYASHEDVRGVRVPDDDPAKPDEKEALLFPGLLRGSTVGPHAGVTPHAGAQALGGFPGPYASGEGRVPEGASVTFVEGRQAHEPGVCDRGPVSAASGGTDPVRVYGDAQQPEVHPGTSSGDGASPGAPIVLGGVGASPQRDQERQPAHESGDTGQRNAQTRTHGDPARTPCCAGRDRSVEACASAIPEAWYKYFIRTGYAIRRGAAAMLDEQSGIAKPRRHLDDCPVTHGASADCVAGYECPSGSGGASRFFYVSKASRAEREAGLDHLPRQSAGELTGGRKEGSAGLDNPRAGAGRTSASGRANTHPTVKPIALMRWLVRLITPPGGVVLDPYCGSGSTGCAAVLEGFAFLGCELSEEYCTIATARIAHAMAQAS